MVPTSLIPCAADGVTPRRLPPQVPVSFCFLMTACVALPASMAVRACASVSAAMVPVGASSAKVRYRMVSPPCASSQPTGIRYVFGVSRAAPYWRDMGWGKAAQKYLAWGRCAMVTHN